MKTELLGISFSIMGSKEALKKTNSYLKEKRLRIVAYVSAHELILVHDNEERNKWWTKIDLTVCEDEEVLKAVGMTEPARIREAKDKKYLHEFLKLLSMGRKEIFLITKKEESLITFEEKLKKLQPDLKIVGKAWADAYPENKEGLINSINLLAPEIILSQLPYPEGIRLIYDYSKYSNASLWCMMSQTLNQVHNYNWLDKMNKFINKKLLNRIINHSKDTEKEEI